MNEEEPSEAESQHDGLVSRLALIEDRPLAERAEAYGQVHDELSRVLEGGDRERAPR